MTIHGNSVFTQAGVRGSMARLLSERSGVNISIMLVLALAYAESKEVAMRVSRERILAPLPNGRARRTRWSGR
ncbi:MAG TPA: hypothetical protein VF463_14735 [Sphingobium sp.]